MASSRQLPTHKAVRTMGDGAGYDYSSAVTWEAATDNSITGAFIQIASGSTNLHINLQTQDMAAHMAVGDIVYIYSGAIGSETDYDTGTISAVQTGAEQGAPGFTVSSALNFTPAEDDNVAFSEILEVYDKGSDYEEGAQVALVDAVTNSDFYRIIMGASKTSKPSFAYTAGSVLRIAENYGRIYDCEATMTADAALAQRAIRINNCDGGVVVGCKATCTNSGAGPAYGVESNLPDGATSYIINCDARANGEWAIRVASIAGSNTHIIYNCTGHDADTVIFVASGTCIVKNTLGSGVFDGNGNFDATSDYNANEQVILNAPPGDHSRYLQDFVFVNEGSGNFRLSPTDDGALRYGTDLSSDANYPFDDDYDGKTRLGTWDIGAYQTTMPATFMHYRRQMEEAAWH